MAIVYLATDVKHSREVAVKVIRDDVAASIGRDRFLREISIAARLRHPNIMPLFDSGDADGQLYFVMPYEAGQSLRARLDRDRTLPIDVAVGVLRDVARALAYAHAQGVVHRDIKPDNVMLSGGAAVVTDFGIAKAISMALGDMESSAVTQTGVGIGTPTYMAPEQAIGDPATDHRADIYAFGCLAYETFAGSPPFAGKSGHQQIAAHMSATPDPVTRARPDVPAAVAQLIARCLEKDPANRPQSAQELLDILDIGTPVPSSMRTVRPGRKRSIALALGALGVAAMAYVALRMQSAQRSSGTEAVTVAVLPMTSIGGDSLQPLVAGGLSDDIQAALVRFPWVRVISRDGVRMFRDSGSVQSIGKQLGARYLVRGSYRTLLGVTTIIAELVDVSDRGIVWSGKFERPAQLIDVRDAIASSVSDSLRPKRSAFRDTIDAPAAHRLNDDAYRLYLMGQRKLDQRGLSLGESISLFRQAIAMDSLSARAYSGLSLALALSPYFQDVSSASVASDARDAAQRAQRLDPRLSEPHVALGLVCELALDWTKAGDEFRTAMALAPHDVEARVQYGRYLLYRNRAADGLREFQAARVDDPASALVSSWTAFAYMLVGRLDSAQTELDRAIEINPMNRTTIALGSSIRVAAGRKAEARLLALRDLPLRDAMALNTLAATGERDSVMIRLARLDHITPAPWLAETSRAFAYLGLRDTSKALAAFERATAAKELWPVLTPVSAPLFDDVRSSARFRTLLSQVGLPTEYVAASSLFPKR